jgi:hypothetical protein
MNNNSENGLLLGATLHELNRKLNTALHFPVLAIEHANMNFRGRNISATIES